MKRSRDSEPEVVLAESYLEQHVDAFSVGIKHILSIDPTLRPVIERSPFMLYAKDSVTDRTLRSCFTKLAGSIIAQQISGIAAKNIRGRIEDMFGGTFPNYKTLHQSFENTAEKQRVKACGLSQRKLSYLESLVEYFTTNEDTIESLFSDADDDKIIEELVKNIKGIGPWSAKMFLVTGLLRPNVFAADDLGLARGCSRYLEERPEILKQLMAKRTLVKKSKIKHKNFKWKIHDEDVVELCGDLFKPHRTLFMFILWRMSDTNMDAVIQNEKRFTKR